MLWRTCTVIPSRHRKGKRYAQDIGGVFERSERGMHPEPLKNRRQLCLKVLERDERGQTGAQVRSAPTCFSPLTWAKTCANDNQMADASMKWAVAVMFALSAVMAAVLMIAGCS